jgi:hypothetical protein
VGEINGERKHRINLVVAQPVSSRLVGGWVGGGERGRV